MNPDKETEEQLHELEQDIASDFAEAGKDVGHIASEYLEPQADRYKEMQEQKKQGDLTKVAFAVLASGLILGGATWYRNRLRMAQRINTASHQAADRINDTAGRVFVLNHNYSQYLAEMAFQRTIMQYLTNGGLEEYLLERPNLFLQYAIDDTRNMLWLSNQMTRAVVSGIHRGEDIETIADRLQGVANAGRTAAIRAARTAVTGAQNSARYEVMREAERWDSSVKKEWIATKDGRTRDSHGAIDGQRVGIEERFANGLLYPGDSAGPSAEIANCRCSMREIYPNINDEHRLTYEEWRDGREQDGEWDTIQEHRLYGYQFSFRGYN